MRFGTPKFVEDRIHRRVGVHLFRCGVHVKSRRDGTYRHLIVKVSRSAAFGRPKQRRQLWVGWWESQNGVKGQLDGFRFVAALDRLPPRPANTIPIPFYPQAARREDDGQ